MDYTAFIPATVRDRIIQFLVSKIGGAIVPVIAFAVGACVAKLTAFSPDLAALVDQKAVVAFVWGVLMIAVNYATTHWLTRDAKAVQQALVKTGAALDVDGWIGDQTVKAIEAQGIEVRKAIPANAPAAP